MAVIALVALEMAAMRIASEGWVDVTRYLTVATLATATYLARYRRGDHGEWWFGFALFGWSYFALVLDAVGRRGFAVGLGYVPLPFLPPVTVLGLLGGEAETSNGPTLSILLWNRYEILQSILTLIIGSAGGIACYILARRRGTPYREEVRRAGRLELDGEGPGP